MKATVEITRSCTQAITRDIEIPDEELTGMSDEAAKCLFNTKALEIAGGENFMGREKSADYESEVLELHDD